MKRDLGTSRQQTARCRGRRPTRECQKPSAMATLRVSSSVAAGARLRCAAAPMRPALPVRRTLAVAAKAASTEEQVSQVRCVHHVPGPWGAPGRSSSGRGIPAFGAFKCYNVWRPHEACALCPPSLPDARSRAAHIQHGNANVGLPISADWQEPGSERRCCQLDDVWPGPGCNRAGPAGR